MQIKMSQTPVAATLIMFAALAVTGATGAALPAQIDGQPLPSLAPLIHEVNPAVVNIVVATSYQTFGRRGTPRWNQRQGAGSGVIVDAEAGLILTNHHVVGEAERVTVKLARPRSS